MVLSNSPIGTTEREQVKTVILVLTILRALSHQQPKYFKNFTKHSQKICTNAM
jgi:hypothetical protein